MLRTDEPRSFAGCALVYGLPVYIDTVSGQGVADVLGRMSKFLDGFARWRHSDPMFGKADMRQEAYAAALEGMRSYRHGCAQLSTFLHRHVLNRMIDLKRDRRFLHVEMPDMAAPQGLGPEEALDLAKEMDRLGDRWGRIMRRIFVNGEHIVDVAKDERMSPWGLTRALKRKIGSAKRAERHADRNGRP